ncbi:hypothetical protein MPLB_2040006 [Mesorhizobium sp. ORS 3324]|nr:hypothetical protein MPLB_2040006 [Mesorhizobium sp. ORS 3324]
MVSSVSLGPPTSYSIDTVYVAPYLYSK